MTGFVMCLSGGALLALGSVKPDGASMMLTRIDLFRVFDMRLLRRLLLPAVIIAALPLAPARAAPMDADGGQSEVGPAAVALAMGAVFTVHSADDQDRFLGSAFLWGAAGEVAVTNAHVVGEAGRVRLTDAAGHQEIGEVIARDPVRDVAVIAVAPGRVGLMAAAGAVQLGQPVLALGAPLGVEFTVTSGTISALARQVEVSVPIRMVQHDAAVNPGSSGGPLVDLAGGLVGMNSQIADGSRMYVGIAYAIPAAALDRIVAGVIAETLPAYPQLGLRGRAVDRQLAAALGIAAGGVLVDALGDGGLGARAGLAAGDVIRAVDGIDLAAPGDLPFLIEAAQAASDSARLGVLRAGELIELTLPLTPAPQAGLTLRSVGAGPQRVARYSIATLGLRLGEGGRIESVTYNSPALLAGVAQGDRILQMNGQPVDLAALAAAEITAPVLFLLVAQDGVTRHVLVDPWGGADRLRPVGGANVLDPEVVVF